MTDKKQGWTTRRKLVTGTGGCVAVGLAGWGAMRSDDMMKLLARYVPIPGASAKTAGSATGGGTPAQAAPALPTINGRDAAVAVITPRH